MAYSTLADIETRFGEDVVRRMVTPSGESQPGTVDTAVVAVFIGQADRLIDMYLGKLYTVPLSTVPAFIADLSQELTLLLLARDRHGALKGSLQDRYSALIALLEKLADGTYKVPGLAFPTNLRPASNTDDGRAHIYTTSHYDENGNKIETDDYVGSMDGLP